MLLVGGNCEMCAVFVRVFVLLICFENKCGVVAGGRLSVCWCGGRRTSTGVVVAGQVLFILKIFQKQSLHCDWH